MSLLRLIKKKLNNCRLKLTKKRKDRKEIARATKKR